MRGEFVLLVTVAANKCDSRKLVRYCALRKVRERACPATWAAHAFRHVDRRACFASKYYALIKLISYDTAGDDGR